LVNPVTGSPYCRVTAGCEKDIDIAVDAAQRAYDNSWGLRTSGEQRGKLLLKLATLIEEHTEELTALEILHTGTTPCDVANSHEADSFDLIQAKHTIGLLGTSRALLV
jgi:aldehyde dehydrogenase (NAD+)